MKAKVCFALLTLLLSLKPEQSSAREVFIVYGSAASGPEIHAANELAQDMEKVYGFRPHVISELKALESGKRLGAAMFHVGTPNSHSYIARLAEKGEVHVSPRDPGPEAFVIKSFPKRREVIIAGCDQRGTLYGVYEFSRKYLGIDPMAYWIGKEPEKRESFEIPEVNLRKSPPAFPLRGYFDNDSDMLANFKGRKLIIEFDLWKEMIDTLARLGYNFIDPFDTMGRTEFWVWPYYKRLAPDFKSDLELINKVMDYAHEKGLMVQVSTYLGYQFYHLPYRYKCLSLYYDKWIEAYRHLIYETPAGKADIFYHSPRDPWWDRPYFCLFETMLGINPSKYHSRLLNELTNLVLEKNPEAMMMGLLWSDGKKHWQNDIFAPDERVTMVWADDGYGRFPNWPEDFKGHRFGIYIHAGFFRNHVVQDPYPRRIKESILEAYKRGMNNYIFVNGQDFKHFLLNLEACARAAWDPEGFDPDDFYREWTERYFGEKAAPFIIESLKALHQAHDIIGGGFAHLNMENNIAAQMAKTGLPYCKDRSYLEPALTQARRSLELAEKGRLLVPDHMLLPYDDQILFPAKIFLANLELHEAVMGIVDGRCALLSPSLSMREKKEALRKARDYKKVAGERLARLKTLLNQGSGWDKWEGWTKVENFRKYQPPLEEEKLERIIAVF